MNAYTQTETIDVQTVDLPQAEVGQENGPAFLNENLTLIADVKVKLEAHLGNAELSIAELFALKDGSVIKLDALVNSPVSILLDGKPVAAGELVVVDEHFGISITQINKHG